MIPPQGYCSIKRACGRGPTPERKDEVTVITLSDVQQARERIAPYILRTPLLRVPALDEDLGCQVYLKDEGLQLTGSFKIRGATNCMLSLTDEQRKCGVVAASSGNHAQGVACAARRLGVDAVIVMPTDVNPVKLAGVQAYGARTELVGTLGSQRLARARELVEQEGRTEIHPYADPYVAAGQGTLGLEIMEDLPDVDAVVVPIGGGGLISGVSTAVKGLRPQTHTIGVEPAGAPRYAASRAAGRPVKLDHVDTIADGTRTDAAVQVNFEMIQARVDELVAAEDPDILRAMQLLVRKGKVVAEPSSVMGLAAALAGRLDVRREDKVVFVLSGANNDLSLLARCLTL